MTRLVVLSLAFAPATGLTTGTPARPRVGGVRAGPLVAQLPWQKSKKQIVVSKDEAIAFKDPKSLTDDEERKLKLEVGTNWKPRTSTVKGEGYQFFQGPTPKTAVQEDMPDFFSTDNFAQAGALGLVQLAIIAVGGVLFLALLGVLVTS